MVNDLDLFYGRAFHVFHVHRNTFGVVWECTKDNIVT